jgi:hypothetical protein
LTDQSWKESSGKCDLLAGHSLCFRNDKSAHSVPLFPLKEGDNLLSAS